jgi:nicotinic acid mononucleotide adenylyltransferase
LTRVPSGDINFDLYTNTLESWKKELGAQVFNDIFFEANAKNPDTFRSFDNYKEKLETIESIVIKYEEYKKNLSRDMTQEVKDNEEITDMFGNTLSYYKGEG